MKKKLKVALLGGGSWGTTAASLTARNSPTTMWARDAEKIIIKTLKKIRKFSPQKAATCTVQMQVLSNLRNLQDTIKKRLSCREVCLFFIHKIKKK